MVFVNRPFSELVRIVKFEFHYKMIHALKWIMGSDTISLCQFEAKVIPLLKTFRTKMFLFLFSICYATI